MNIEEFKAKPVDEQIDHIIRHYHDTVIRGRGPQLKALIDKTVEKEGEAHPSLFEVQELYHVSLMDLMHHIEKEEQVLFPYMLAMYQAKQQGQPVPPFHCGSVAFPIEVMRIEHTTEDERYHHINDLTGGYDAPEDADDDYRRMLAELKDFNEQLLQHIYLENEILFPEGLRLERE